MVDYETAIGLDLQKASLVEIQREKLGVGENTFLTVGTLLKL